MKLNRCLLHPTAEQGMGITGFTHGLSKDGEGDKAVKLAVEGLKAFDMSAAISPKTGMSVLDLVKLGRHNDDDAKEV